MTVTGTAIPGYLVTIYDETGETVGLGYADDEGVYEIVTDSLADGQHQLQATQTDATGTESPLSSALKLTIDTTVEDLPAPVLQANKRNDTGASDSDGITSNTTPTITGIGAEKGATITLYDDSGDVMGTTVAKSNGSWSLTPTTPFTDGIHSIFVTQTDAAGNESNESDPLELVVDNTAPDPADAPDLAAETDTGDADDDNITASRTLTFTGVAEAGATVELLRDGRSTKATAVVDESGNWTITINKVKDGTSEWSVAQTDLAGNKQSVGEALSVTVVTRAPAAPGSLDLVTEDDTGTSDHDNLTSVSTPTITGTGVAGAVVTLFDTDGTTELGSDTVAEDGTWSIVTTELADGEHLLRAVQTDAVGNTSKPSKPLKMRVDTEAPAPAAPTLKPGKKNDTGAFDDDGITSNPRPVFVGSGAERGAVITLLDQDGEVLGTTTARGNGTWQIQPAADLPTGLYTFTVTQSDAAGNTSLESVGFDLDIDVTPPDPADAPDLAAESDTGTSSEDNVTASRTLVFTGTAEPGAMVRLMRGGRAFGDTVQADETTGEWTLTVHNAPKGVTAWSVQQTDLAGNVQTEGEALEVNVSLSRPGKVSGMDLATADDTGSSDSDNLTNHNEVNITGLAAAGNTVTLFDSDGTELGTTVAGEDGSWSITTTTLADGQHILRAVQTDAVGNSSKPSSPLKLTVDTQATAPTDATLVHKKKYDTGSSDADGITSNAQPLITGQGAEKNATVTIYDQDGTVLGTTRANGRGAWKFNPATALADGTYELTAVQTDLAGNESEASTPFTVTIDTTAPVAAAAPDLAAASDDGAADDDNITTLRDLTFTGFVEAGVTVQLYSNGKKMGDAVTADEAGFWSVTVTGVKLGESQWWVTQTDLAGNIQETGDILTVNVIAA